MKHFMLTAMTFKVLLTLALFSLNVNAEQVNSALFSGLKTFAGKDVEIDKGKTTHYVFIDLWRSYEGKGDEEMMASLPDKFLQLSQQIWVQPEVNVTKAQLKEFQGYFPKVMPLVLDQQFTIMRGLGVWQSPFHVLIKDNKKVFSGDQQALRTFISKTYSVEVNEGSEEQEKANVIAVSEDSQIEKSATKVVNASKLHKPVKGDKAPQFSAKTLTGEKVNLADMLVKISNKKPLNLIFMDALCPMPHFPDCAAKLRQVNELIMADKSRQWLGVVNSYYVDEAYALAFSKTFTLKLPLIFDQDNSIYRAYDVYASPYQVKINKQGIIESRGDLLN